MADTDMFDIMFQFHQTAIQDLQLRILNVSPSTNLWVKSRFSRRIEQPVAPLEIKAYWNKPQVTISNGYIKPSAEVNGGARQVETGRILTLDGAVSAWQNATLAVDASGRPYACVQPPDPLHVSMRKMKVSYEGSRWPSFLARFDPAREETLLRPVLTTQLFGQLARIPLTYMPSSFPVVMPMKKRTATHTLSIVHALAGILNAPASVALGLMLDKTHTAPSTFASLLPEKVPYNAAISISTQGLNTLLAHLCHQGKAMGQLQHSRLGRVNWHWETLTVTLHHQVVHIDGVLVQQGFRARVQAAVQCQLVNDGCLQGTLLSSNTDALMAETLLASWIELLKTFFRSRATNKQNTDAYDQERLFQCFGMPTTAHTVETVAQELVVTDTQLIIYYTIPKSLKEVPLEFPPPKPTVTIVQPHIPRQTAKGAPVTIKLGAKITKDSTPPYDYTWTTDLSPEPRSEHGSKLTIRSGPLVAGVGSGPQKLTTAHLKVIDMFGQVSEAQAPAQYLPSMKEQKSQRNLAQSSSQQKSTQGTSRRKVLAVLSAAAMALGGIGAAEALTKLFDPPPTKRSCPPDQTPCHGTCVKTSTDPYNCGSCGTVCSSGQFCVSGRCQCSSGQTSCNGTCMNTKTDSSNCGSCGHVCPSSAATCCGGSCVDTKTDSSNCGSCGHVCLSGTTCNGGSCPSPCSSGLASCNGTCVNMKTDSTNCGSCGTICPSGIICCGGSCVDTKTDSSNCGSCGTVCPSSAATCCNGSCVDTNTDNNNCGSCGTVCPSGTTCNGGSCSSPCPSGQTLCNGTCCSATCCNGSCVDTNTDSNNCGACGTVCPSGQVCANGSCQCSSGTLCNGTCCSATCCNGSCVDTNTDNNNCGSCGTVCPSGTTCNGGSCSSPCPSGQTLCNGTCCSATCCSGSCVDTNSDNNNCGSCGYPCPSGQVCVSGSCLCSSGTLCNGTCCSATCCNGSCVDTNTDSNNCGACGTVCLSGQVCANGSCQCSSGTLCNGTCVNTSTDSSNCGGCGNACSYGETCCNGSCAYLDTDPNNCGSCGNVCSYGETCCWGACVNTNTDSSNCGSCGNVCQGSAPLCCSGTCVDSYTDPNNCGSCGNVCRSPAYICQGGQCQEPG